ncbi:hypothetical protein HYFRA_00001127 [Hymenoscyphus fraxineus]|uniref:Uncharacterized protein n=1 Tax=Hymenoscyphus fraxineus TaxID=746836 RepID=A0A9N9KUI2_9HELO|nr:hypothetical protein HYFRA_00001127 [Hymenoscyphus fraxineus]
MYPWSKKLVRYGANPFTVTLAPCILVYREIGNLIFRIRLPQLNLPPDADADADAATDAEARGMY